MTSFTPNPAPTFAKQPKLWTTSIGNNDASGWKLFMDSVGAGAGPNGAAIDAVIGTSTDGTARSVVLGTARSYAGVTMTIASPGVISWPSANGNNVAVGDQVMFLNNGDTLPTGLAFNTTYWVISGGFSVGASFELAASAGGSVINTTGSQSGTHLIAVIRPVVSGSIAITSGTDGVTAPTNMLSPAIAVGMPLSSDGNPLAFLESGDFLAVQALTTVTANKVLSLSAFGANF